MTGCPAPSASSHTLLLLTVARPLVQEARVARVLSRAAAPRFQKGGKPAMTRSVLHKAEVEGVRERGTDGEEELAAFLSIVDEALEESA